MCKRMTTRNRTVLTLAVVAMAVFAGPAQAGPLKGELGILTPGTLAGNNPATGAPWAIGDTYRFAFHTSATTTAESTDIATYNTWVQSLANASTAYDIGADDGVTWKVIGSTDDVNAIDNTSTTWTDESPGSPIFLLDGSTLIASNYKDLWDGEIQHIINLTEEGLEWAHWPFTGTYTDGTKAPGHATSFSALGGGSQIHQGKASITTEWIWRMWTGDPPETELPMYALSDPLVIVGPPNAASNPNPANGATDVCGTPTLIWSPGELADKHDVYLGTNFDDVNDADRSDPRGVLANQGQIATMYDPGRLDFGQTYYWRIDEVNAPPDSTIFKGFVWSFTTEPIGYPIDGANITATASSSINDSTGPEKTIDGSGLNGGDLHSINLQDMWLSDMLGPQPTWIEYQFDKVYKLHEIWVWNQNQVIEPSIGYGFKDVTIEYSVDGIDYTTLGTTHEFAGSPGVPDNEHETTVDLGDVIAKYVRLTAKSNWKGYVAQYGLSEVRFFSIPVFAREPSPDSGATDVDVNVTLGWRAGREAATHNVYLGTDEQAVIDGAVVPVSVTDASYGSAFDLGSTYYWRIDEVNEAETPAVWQGDVWDFTTQEFIVVDDFESYNDIPVGQQGSDPVFVTWLDGFDNPSANGSIIGYNEAFQPFMETSIVYGDSRQSVPLFYDNTVASYSEVSVNTDDLAIGRDWTTGSPTTMTLRFYGDPNNAATEQLYVKIGGTKVNYPGDAAELTRPSWSEWNIDLTVIDLSNVPTLAIGFDRTGAGGAGFVYLDEIYLYR